MHKFQKLTKTANGQGYGECIVGPGLVLHQALLTGVITPPYLLHYDIVAVGNIKLGYINRKGVIKSLEMINNNASDDLV